MKICSSKVGSFSRGGGLFRGGDFSRGGLFRGGLFRRGGEQFVDLRYSLLTKV